LHNTYRKIASLGLGATFLAGRNSKLTRLSHRPFWPVQTGNVGVELKSCKAFPLTLEILA
jgi:hypothetical protein